MAQSIDLLHRYCWLIETVARSGGLSFASISDAWERSALNPYSGAPLPRRTFVAHRKAIADVFGIEIKYSKKEDRYHIENVESVEGVTSVGWIINTLSIENTLRNSPEMRNRIILDAVDKGSEWLSDIVEAMNKNRCLKIAYRSFHNSEPVSLELEPYCLRSYGRRWYLLGRDLSTNKLDCYGTDRIQDLKVLPGGFTLPSDFNAEAYFADYAGVIVNPEIPLVPVKISIDDDFAPHLRNVPLHPSQREGKIRYEDGSEDATFEWYLRPTPDFLMELYRYGSSLEVLEPIWIRNTIARWAAHHKQLYS